MCCPVRFLMLLMYAAASESQLGEAVDTKLQCLWFQDTVVAISAELLPSMNGLLLLHMASLMLDVLLQQ